MVREDQLNLEFKILNLLDFLIFNYGSYQSLTNGQKVCECRRFLWSSEESSGHDTDIVEGEDEEQEEDGGKAEGGQGGVGGKLVEQCLV